VPTADLRLVMSRAADLQVGQAATYTLTVSNAGPNQEDGPITVTDTLPSGFSSPSGSGPGWTCATSGLTVTCTYPNPLAAGASLAPITITAQLTAAGTYTNSATVTGTEFDNATANNTASDTASSISQGGLYALTNAACQAGVALGPTGPCDRFRGPVVAGADVTIYVTAVDAAGVPVAVSTTTNTTRQAAFALACNDPVADAGVRASYGGASLALCSANGQAPASGSTSWSNLSLTFQANKPSVALTFRYGDVGRVTLNLKDSTDKGASATFTVRPSELVLEVRRARDNVPNPGASDGTGLGFATAGEELRGSVQACALPAGSTSGCVAAPNFGKEKDPQKVRLEERQTVVDKLKGTFNDPAVNGKYTATKLSYEEVGVIQLRPVLASAYFDVDAQAVPSLWSWVGRFYPAYFITEIAGVAGNTGVLSCLPKMLCPSDLTTTGENMMRGAVYSGEKFVVTAKPMSYLGNELAGFVGDFGRNVTLEAFARPGGATAPAAGKFNCNLGVLEVAKVAAGLPAAQAAHCFTTAFSNAAPRALNWSPPTPVYVRATAQETVIVADPANPAGTTTATVTVTSKDVGFEAGVTVLAGRLLLANAFGSELLKLPVGLTAQYWTGTAWENNTADNSSVITGSAGFSQCAKALAFTSRATPNCRPQLALVPAQQVTLVGGAGKLWLQAPGAGFAGSGYMDLTGLGSPPWLPGTLGRVTFGIYKSPLIYIREMY
jgi:uncharacterized repeat protein (TIGR01451 family)